MKRNVKDIARLIDISAVQVFHGKKEINELVAIAKREHFLAVHALPSWTSYLRDAVAGSGVLVGGPVGFPSGGHTTEVKVLEARGMARDGVDEMDMMINVGRLKAGDDEWVYKDIQKVIEAAGEIPVKVILEILYLTDDEIKRACEICIRAGAAFVKTGTGWHSGGTTVERIRLIASFTKDAIRIKAAGGVRGLETVRDMLELGVARFGINVQASIDVLREVEKLPGGVLETKM